MSDTTNMPLAARMRPQSLAEVFGQQHLLGEGKPLYRAIANGRVHSMILWGPPGTGKTTLAKLMAQQTNAELQTLSAVLAGVKDIREVVANAKKSQQATILFIDEIHRFNKAQQDALLPHVEDGTVTLIGATTENPSFEINNALLSRVKVYVLKSLDEKDILSVINFALNDKERGLGDSTIDFTDELKKQLATFADGDARMSLSLLDIMIQLADEQDGKIIIDEAIVKEVLTEGVRRFDKGGEYFYDQISALHKAVRGSSPDAALYWLACMLVSGMDPAYLMRRVVRMASEDIGNADPRALRIALDAWEAYERLGSPEGELAIAQAVVYMACAAKSNAVYTAFNEAWRDAKNFGTQDVPMHLRNAPTKLMKELGYGKTYRYAHDEPHAYAAGENYFPENIKSKKYYQPVPRGLEIKIAEKLKFLQSLDTKVQ